MLFELTIGICHIDGVEDICRNNEIPTYFESHSVVEILFVYIEVGIKFHT